MCIRDSNTRLLEGKVLQAVPGLEVKVTQVVKVGALWRFSTPIPQQAVFEAPVAVKAKRLHKPDHRWLAYLYLICQFCDGAPVSYTHLVPGW